MPSSANLCTRRTVRLTQHSAVLYFDARARPGVEAGAGSCPPEARTARKENCFPPPLGDGVSFRRGIAVQGLREHHMWLGFSLSLRNVDSSRC